MAKRDVEVEFSLIDGVSKGLAKIDKSLGGVSTQLVSVSAAAVATTAAVGAIAIGAVFADGVKDAAAFEVSLDRISARTGVTGDALAKLGDSIQKISEDATKTGEQGAAAFQKLAEEGLSAEQALTALPTVLNFATTAAQGTTEAVGGLADTLDQFGLSAENIPRAADVITAAALTAGTGVTQLQAALTAAGPTARDLGLTLEQTAAAIAVLAQNGIEGGKAGKALATTFDQLRDPSSKLRAELQKIGITSTDFNVVLQQLAKAGPKAASAFNALGLQGTAALKALAQNGGKALTDITNQLANVEGATDKAAATINANLSGAFDRLSQAFDRAQTKFLTPLLGPLADELETLRGALDEFIESPAFDKLSTDFRDAFLQALEAVKKFVAEFDLSDALKSLQDFTAGAGEDLRGFKESVDEIAAGIKAAVATIQAVFNAIQTGTAAAVAGTARAFQKLNEVFGLVSDRSKEVAIELGRIADIAEKETGKQAAELAANIETLSGEMYKAANATDTASESLASASAAALEVGPAYDEAAQDAARLANNQKILADAGNKLAIEQDAAGTAIGKLAKELPGAIAGMEGLAEASAGELANYKKTTDAIQASIDATKQFASSAGEAADAVDDISTAAEGARDTLDEALSGAIFQGLSEGISRVSSAMSLLEGVSETAIRDKLQGNLRGAINEFKGLNDQIVKYDAFLRSAAGAEQLARANRELERRNELLATATQRAKEAAQAQRDLTATLQDQADARNLTEGEQEARRYQEQLRQIEELARTRGRLGAMDAEKQRQLAAAEHEARLAEIRAEQTERVRATEEADDAIAGRRRGQGVVFAAGEAQASEAQTAATQSIVINVNALDLRNAPEFVDRLDSELRRKAKASL